MPEGSFQTDRVIFDNPIWKNPAKFRLFFYIYGNAVFSKDGVDIAGIHLDRGQLLKSYRNLSDELEYLENHSLKRYSISHIKKMIDELIEEKRLQMEISPLGTVFTVLNYEQYQGFERFEKDNREHSENTERTERERSENNNKNDKNDKNVSKKEKINKKEKVDYRYEIVLPPPPSLVDKNLWELFVEHRKSMKKPLSIHACELFYKDFRKWDNEGIDVNECIKTSITNGWQGIFERNNQKTSQTPSQNPNWQVLKDWEKSRSEA